jgi:hypothetical protein
MAPRKSSISVTSRADSAKTRNVVLARRLASGNPDGGGNRSIPLKEPERWYTRIENCLVDSGRFYKMVHELGYEPVKPEDLACTPAEIGFTVSPDGNIVRGPLGADQEMLFKMPKEDRALLDEAMTRRNMQGIGSASKVKADLANAAGGALGGEAGDYIANLDGGVIDRITGGDAA